MVTGQANVRRLLAAIPPSVAEAVRAQLEKEATKVVAQMKALAPVRRGALRDSIGWTWGDAPAGAVTLGTVRGAATARIAITIYAGGAEGTGRQQNRNSGGRKRDQRRSGTFDTDNARFQEFGTRRMPANPFFFPAWRANKARVRANLRSAVTRAVTKLKR